MIGWLKTPSSWRFFDSQGNYIVKIIKHRDPDRIIWFFVDDPLSLPVKEGFDTMEAAESDCMSYINRGMVTLSKESL